MRPTSRNGAAYWPKFPSLSGIKFEKDHWGNKHMVEAWTRQYCLIVAHSLLFYEPQPVAILYYRFERNNTWHLKVSGSSLNTSMCGRKLCSWCCWRKAETISIRSIMCKSSCIVHTKFISRKSLSYIGGCPLLVVVRNNLRK